MPMWNPWRGCRKCSEGCLHCYIHKGDAKRGVDTGQIVRTKDFAKPVERLKSGLYRMKAGLVYTCFSTDFLVEEADAWRDDCWAMMKERSDCMFLFLTKRIERLADCLPADWGDGYANVAIGCTIENQRNADRKLPIFQQLPIRHRCITAQPLLERISLEPYLAGIERVLVGGESDRDARRKARRGRRRIAEVERPAPRPHRRRENLSRADAGALLPRAFRHRGRDDPDGSGVCR